MEIRRLNRPEYHIAFNGYHTALSMRSAAEALAGGCIYGARIDGAYAGYLCVLDEIDAVRVTYALTVPAFRNRGVFTALLRHVIQSPPRKAQFCISPDHPSYPIVRRCCDRLGFVRDEDIRVFYCRHEDRDKWQAFMNQKGAALCATLERRGYKAVPFRELTPALLDQLRCSDRSEYGNGMFHPALYLDNPDSRLSRTLSFAAVINGRLAAYSLVTMEDEKTAQFAQLSVSAAEQGHGVILLPFSASIRCFFDKGLSRACYAMYESNEPADAFRKKVLTVFDASETRLEGYSWPGSAKEAAE